MVVTLDVLLAALYLVSGGIWLRVCRFELGELILLCSIGCMI